MTKARDLANIISGGFTESDIPNLATSKITSGTFADARLPATALNSNVDLTTLSASNLTSGTLADARFPATLPAVSGANLTSLPATLNTPAFEAYKPSSQDINDATYTKISFATQLFDITNVYDADVYSRFTPGGTGKYFLHAQIMFETTGGHEVDLAILAIHKNGSRIKYAKQDLANDTTLVTTITCSTVVDSDTNDYFEVYAYLDRTSGGAIKIIGDGSDGQTSSFGAYKINT